MRLIANRQLTGSYGTVIAGQEFEVENDLGRQLLLAGTVRKPEPPRITYQTKVVTPEAPEVSTREPFRDMPVPHEESPDVVAEGDSMLSGAEVPEEGTAHSRGRGRRARSGSGR